MALLRQSHRNNAEAEACFREAMETRRRVLGADDRDTIASINNLCLQLQLGGTLSKPTQGIFGTGESSGLPAARLWVHHLFSCVTVDEAAIDPARTFR